MSFIPCNLQAFHPFSLVVLCRTLLIARLLQLFQRLGIIFYKLFSSHADIRQKLLHIRLLLIQTHK